MKDFFKNVFATFVGVFLFGLATVLLGLACIFGMLLSDNTEEVNEKFCIGNKFIWCIKRTFRR